MLICCSRNFSRQMIALSALDVFLRNTDHETLVVVSRSAEDGAWLLMHVLTAPMMSLLFCLPWRWQRNVFTEGAEICFCIFVGLSASCTAGISVHPDIPRQADADVEPAWLSSASFSLPSKANFIPNLLSMWQVQLCYWFGQVGFNVLRMRSAYCLPPLGCACL